MTTTSTDRSGTPAPIMPSHTAPHATSQTQASPAARGGLAAGFARMFSSLSNRDFAVLWFGMLASFLAMNMQMVARGYLAYEIGGTATTLGLVTLGWGVPQLLLAPLGGVVADRFPKRNLLIVTQSLVGITTLANAILISLGIIEVWHLVAIGVVQGGSFAFNMPARQAMVPELVGRESMANAIAVNNAGMNLTRVLGPVLAGVLISVPFIGTAGAFYFMAACYLVVLATLFNIPAGAPAVTTKRGNMAAEMTAGMRYIWNDRVLLPLVALAFIPVLLAWPYQALMPVLAKEEFGAGSEGLGILMGAVGIGALLGSLAVAYFSESGGKAWIQLGAGVAFGVTLALFAAAPDFLTATILMLFVGAASNIYMALNNTMIMANCDSRMHGRVMSVYIMSFSMMPLATMPMSAIADLVGSRWTVGVAGAATALIIAAAALLVPAVRRTP